MPVPLVLRWRRGLTIFSVQQRDNSLGDHMCAFDEMGVDTDGGSRKRTLGVKTKKKPGRTGVTNFGLLVRFACVCRGGGEGLCV